MPDPNQNDQNLNPAGETLDESGASMSPTEGASDGTAIGSDALEAARNEAAQSRDALLRALADSENIRRRAQTDLANAHKYAIENFATNLLAVKDTLEMALNDKASTTEQIKMGVDLTLRNLSAAFDKAKIVEVSPVNQKFDPNRHQAMSEVDSDQPSGTVVQVFQKGYMIADRVLRPAMVAVARAKTAGSGGAGSSSGAGTGGNPVESNGY